MNCPNQVRLQVTCLFPFRVSVSRTIKPILETGCCAKQRPPDFFSQKVILFCVTGIKWIIHFWKTLFYELFVFHPGFIQCNGTMYAYSLMQKFNNIKRMAGMKPQLTSDRLVVVGGNNAVMTLFWNNPSFSIYLDISYVI